MERFWSCVSGIARAEGSRFRLLVHDLVQQLQQYARDESFKLDTHGGSRAQNLLLVQAALQMGHHLLDGKGSQRDGAQRLLQTFMSASSDTVPETLATTDSLPYMLVLSLFVLPLNAWRAARLTFLRRAIVYAHLLAKQARSAAAAADAGQWDQTKHVFMLFGLVDLLHSATKDVKDGDGDGWLDAHRTRLLDVDGSLNAQLRDSTLQIVEEELLPCADLAEFVDVCGTSFSFLWS